MQEERPLARLDRALFDQADFPARFVMPTRFLDVDLQGHVNNTAVPVMLQEARVGFNETLDLRGQLAGLRPMVAAITIEYAAELTHPGEIEILTGVAKIGRRSFALQQVARQNGRTAIYAETVLVIADATGAAALPDGLRHNLELLLLRQA